MIRYTYIGQPIHWTDPNGQCRAAVITAINQLGIPLPDEAGWVNLSILDHTVDHLTNGNHIPHDNADGANIVHRAADGALIINEQPHWTPGRWHHIH